MSYFKRLSGNRHASVSVQATFMGGSVACLQTSWRRVCRRPRRVYAVGIQVSEQTVSEIFTGICAFD